MKDKHQNINKTLFKFQTTLELILTYISNHSIIFISGFIFIIAIIVGIIIYQMNITNTDAKINVDFESALALYNLYERGGLPEEQLQNPQVIVDIATRFQKTHKEAKGKDLKLRAAYALGSIYYDIGNFSEALKYYREVANSRGFYLQENAIYNMANTQIELTNYSQAVNTLENFIKAHPQNYLVPEATLTLSDVYRVQNDRTKSLSVLRNWLIQNTNDTEYRSIFNETVTLIENNVY